MDRGVLAWWCSVLHLFFFFFFNDTATTEIYTLSLHDALPIFVVRLHRNRSRAQLLHDRGCSRSEEHTSELQSPDHLVCRLLLEKKQNKKTYTSIRPSRKPTGTQLRLSYST